MCVSVVGSLTVVRHADHQALLEAAVLTLVARLFVDATPEAAVVVDELQADGSSEETLWGIKERQEVDQ